MRWKLTKKFGVYVDFIEKDGEFIPGYVGKGQQARINRAVRNKQHRNYSKKYHWKRVVGFETDDEAEAFEVERVLICSLCTFAHAVNKTRYACNQSLGGEGATGLILSEEARYQKSIKAKAVWLRPGFRELMIAKCIETQKDHQRKRQLEVWGRPGYKDRLVESHLKAQNRPETIEAQRIAQTGKRRTEETKQKQSASAKIVCARPWEIERRSGANSSRAVAVEQYTIGGIFVSKYDTVTEARKVAKSQHVSDVCLGKRKSAGGFVWKYVTGDV